MKIISSKSTNSNIMFNVLLNCYNNVWLSYIKKE